MSVDHFLDFYVLFALGAPTCCCVAEVDEELFGYELENDDDGIFYPSFLIGMGCESDFGVLRKMIQVGRKWKEVMVSEM